MAIYREGVYKRIHADWCPIQGGGVDPLSLQLGHMLLELSAWYFVIMVAKLLTVFYDIWTAQYKLHTSCLGDTSKTYIYIDRGKYQMYRRILIPFCVSQVRLDLLDFNHLLFRVLRNEAQGGIPSINLSGHDRFDLQKMNRTIRVQIHTGSFSCMHCHVKGT